MSDPTPDHPLLSVAYSHLFRGVQLQASAEDLTPPLTASLVVLEFSDGVMVEAELVELDESAVALAVPAYATGTGHALANALWPIDDVRTDEDTTTIKLGPKVRG